MVDGRTGSAGKRGGEGIGMQLGCLVHAALRMKDFPVLEASGGEKGD